MRRGAVSLFPGRDVAQVRGVLAERVIVSTELDPYLSLNYLSEASRPLPHFRVNGKIVVRRSDFRYVDRGLSPVQGHKRTVVASAQSDTRIRCHGLGICSAEFLISYPHQGRSLGPKTTKRMGAIAACDLHRERRHSVKYDFVSDH